MTQTHRPRKDPPRGPARIGPGRRRSFPLPLRASEALEDRERVDPDFDAFDCRDVLPPLPGLGRPRLPE